MLYTIISLNNKSIRHIMYMYMIIQFLPGIELQNFGVGKLFLIL